MAEALDVARFLIWLAEDEPEPDRLTHLRLQKLLYYVQGWSLAARDKPMFEGTIQAWQHGPVVRELYGRFAHYGDNPIAPDEVGTPVGLTDDQKRFVTSIWEGYKIHSPTALRRMTHEEAPWNDARLGLPEDAPCDKEISHESMKRFFVNEHRKRGYKGATIESLRQAEGDFRQGRCVPLDEAVASPE